MAGQLRSQWPKLLGLKDNSEHNVLDYLDLPRQHRTKINSTNLIERLNMGVERRVNIVGIFPNKASITRLIGVGFIEQKDDWQRARRLNPAY